MRESSTFKIVVIAIFIAFGVLGVIALAAFRGGGSEAERATITLWGTVDRDVFILIDKKHRERTDNSLKINYVEKNPATFESELINALASGTGPDAILATPGFIYKHRDKVLNIPYDSLSESFFKESFIEESELFLTTEGVLALPFSVDPLVMYWNRDILTNAGIANPPTTWNEVASMVSELSVVDPNYNVIQSTIALGEYQNIGNAKEILSTLLLQVGNEIVSQEEGGQLMSVLAERRSGENPSESAVSFYTNFSDPANESYSWNRALPEAQNMFLSGDLAFYLGFASEYQDLIRKNPNLNFGISFIPQLAETRRRTTYGFLRGVAIIRNSQNASSAYVSLLDLSSRDVNKDISEVAGTPPVRRDLLATKPVSEDGVVFYDSALASLGWLDINPAGSSAIFSDLIGAVTSGRLDIRQAVGRASQELDALLGN